MERGFLIVNYELLLRDLEPLGATRPDLVILDEAQRIKNWHTKTARAVKRLSSPDAFILTGTPLENRLPELHSLVEFLHPRALGPRWRLLPFHAVVGPEGRVIAYEGLEVLRGRLERYFPAPRPARGAGAAAGADRDDVLDRHDAGAAPSVPALGGRDRCALAAARRSPRPTCARCSRRSRACAS